MADQIQMSAVNVGFPEQSSITRKRTRKKRKIYSKKITRKQCMRFIASRKPTVCECGHEKNEHNSKALLKSENKTNEDLPTPTFEEIVTDALGEIDFKGTTHRTKAKYVRLSNDTDPKVLFNFMTECWSMEKPRLLISVTGGAKSFKLNPELKKLFAAGLLKVAQTPGAWVITGGTNTGVMKYVGEALKGTTKTCIGVATWGIVSKRNSLVALNERDIGGRFTYDVNSSLIQKGAYLDHNHTHFLLVDDGTCNKYGREIKFRSMLEKYIMEKSSKSDGESVQSDVPSVLLVLEGGPGTLGTVYEAVTSHPPVPVVLIKDSGRAADCLAYALEVIIEGDDGDAPNDELMKFVLKTFPEFDFDYNRKTYKKIIDCTKNRESISVFKMSSGSNVDEAILTALLDSRQTSTSQHVEQLRLTILWDRPDLAQELFFSQTFDWQEEDLTEAMLMSLALNRVGFVKLLLSYGISMTTLISENRLEFLYGYCAKMGASLLSMPLKKKKQGGERAFKRLCEYQGWSASECFVTYDVVRSFIYKLCDKFVRNGTEEFVEPAEIIGSGFSSELKLEKAYAYPFRELFFWAVMNNLHEMAMLFWEFEEGSMAKALIAAEMYRVMAAKAKENDAEEMERILLQNAKDFEELTLALLDECFKLDETKLEKLITAEFKQFPGNTCLDLAIASNQLKYVSHSSVQALLNMVWTGAIKKRDLTARECLLGIFIPPYILTFDFVTENQLKGMVRAEEDDGNRDDEEDDGNEKISDINNGSSTSAMFVGPNDSQKNYETFDDENASDEEIEKELGVVRKLYEFWKAPVTKFYSNILAYFVFLSIFTYVAMLDKEKDTTPNMMEWILLAFVASLTIEEIRQAFESDGETVLVKLKDWSRNYWNLLDLLSIILFYVAFALRLNKKYISDGTVIYAFDVGLYIIRLLDVFFAHRILGPYVIMIGRMFRDMVYFLVILFVFLFAYGVSVTALLKPQKNISNMLRDIVYHPYYNIYGELFIDDGVNAATSTKFGTPVINGYSETLGLILLGFYLLIANVLLLNLLIAIFNNTFTEVQENSSQLWKFQRYYLITEYATRPMLVPPFILLVHLYQICRWLAHKVCLRFCCKWKGGRLSNINHLKCVVNDEERNELMEYEMACVATILRNKAATTIS